MACFGYNFNGDYLKLHEHNLHDKQIIKIEHSYD